MSAQSGSALVLALVALVIVALCVVVVASQLATFQVSIRHDERSAVLDALADAALADAMARLAADPGYQGSATRSFSRGTIGSRIEPSGPTSRRVVATARFLRWVAVIDCEVDVSAGPRVVRARRTARAVETDAVGS